MTITPAMKAAARSAYRNLYRAASATFAAFRMKMRNDAIAARAIVDPETYQGQNDFGNQVADVLRKNIVQGVKVANSTDTPEGHDTFRLRITKDTELGSNETIKNPPPLQRSSRGARRAEKTSQEHHTSVADVAPHNDSFASFSPSHLSMNFSQLKKAHRARVVPELKEEDLEESFVRGSGPLDKIANPGLSKEEFARAKQRERERRRRKKAKKKAADKVLTQGSEEAIDLDELERKELEEALEGNELEDELDFEEEVDELEGREREELEEEPSPAEFEDELAKEAERDALGVQRRL
ncbi:hypothetical protein H0H92_012336 [Tricholoma furcatifolium]|nr:hypothetical protein H0H92_012336 [Tricholoma furcatifolium]